MKTIARTLTPTIKKAAQQFGVVSITGPRQSGKTTVVKTVFPNYDYINLENPLWLTKAQEDPQGIVESAANGLIIDEVQKAPDLLSYIQVAVDTHKKPGQFIITGSENLLLSEKISQSLAGRVATLTLLPLSLSEFGAYFSLETAWQRILDGFYPGLHSNAADRSLFFSSYINTYVERDVRSLAQIGDLTQFRHCLQLLAGRIGQLVNLTSLGNDIGVSHKTVESWISILEASYIVFRLPPFYENYGKRATKTSKIYFYDTGIASYLLGIDSVDELRTHSSRGALFENLIVSDLLKQKHHTHSSSGIYFWRDRTGHEVDVLVDAGGKKKLIEIKSSSSYNQSFIKNLEFFNTLTEQNHPQYLVYNGETTTSIKDTVLFPWRNLATEVIV